MLSAITAGMKVLAFGDSISDPFYYGQYVDRFCAATGTVKLNGNLAPNGSFEGGVTNWTLPNAWGTLTQSTAQAKFGTYSGLLQPTAAGATAGWVIASPGGDSGARQLGFQLGRDYTVSIWVYVPTGTTGSVFVSIYDNDGTGTQNSNSAVAVANGTWQQLSVSRTLRPYSGSGTAEAYVRVQWTGTVNAAQFVYLDGLEIDTGTWSGAQLPPYVGDTATRSAIAGTLLTNAHGDANNGMDTFAARVIGTPDVVIVEYGINDWYNSNGYGLTADGWRQAVHVTLANLQAMSPAPQIVWMGLTQTTTTAPTPPTTGWTGYDTSTLTAFKAAMNLIARQECALFQVPFVTLAELMPTSLVQTNSPASVYPYTASADGIHPTQTGGSDGHNYLFTALRTQIGQTLPAAAPAALPSYLVEMCLSATPTTFTTIPNRIVECKIKRGRSDELTGPMQTGTMTLVLDNGDGAFSPDNAASPYAGYLVPGRRVRISARMDPAAAYSPLYYGYIDSLRPEDNGPLDSNVTIQCVDWLGLMSVKGSINGAVTSGGYGPHDLINWFASLMSLVDSSATYTIVNPTDGTSQHLIDYMLTDANALTALTDFAQTVRGIVFQGADGTIRATANGGTAITTTFDNYFLFDQPGLNRSANVVPYTAMDYDLTTTYLYNDITITAPPIGGGTQNVQDATSITAYQRRSLSYNFAYMGLDQALPYAYTLLTAYADAHPRVHALTIDIDGAAGVWQNGLTAADLLFALDLTAPVTIAKNAPGAVGINRRMVVEGIQHDIKANYGGTGPMHEVTLQLAEFNEIDPGWTLGVSSLGTETALNYGRPTFDPTNLGQTCRLWLRSDRGVTLSGGNVTAWADQSGFGNIASPAGGTVQLGAVTQNGIPGIALNYALTRSYLTLASDPFPQPSGWAAYIVATMNLAANMTLIASTGRLGNGGGGSRGLSISSVSTLNAFENDGINHATASENYTQTTMICVGSYSPFTTTAHINNDGGTAATNSSIVATGGATATIGNASPSAELDVYEVIVFDAPLSASDHAYVLDNLNRKYLLY